VRPHTHGEGDLEDAPRGRGAPLGEVRHRKGCTRLSYWLAMCVASVWCERTGVLPASGDERR
jgi:hypothetical protein